LRINPKGVLAALAAALLWLNPGSAPAQLTSCAAGSVCYYVTIQPIDVCASSGASCAPFNTVNPVGSPGTVGSANPVGFIDKTTGSDITRKMWNQIGVDLVYAPMVQYNNDTYTSITVTGTLGNYSSSQFTTISDYQGIQQGLAPSPSPPLNSNPHFLNMFFIGGIVNNTDQVGKLYGFSAINGNGMMISGGTFYPCGTSALQISGCKISPQVDVPAHEFGHNMGLQHPDQFNTGAWSASTGGCSTTTQPQYGLMTSGATRFVPTSTSTALTDLGSGDGSGTADQLNRAATSGLPCTTTISQQAQVGLSGFLQPIANSTTTASTGKKAATTLASPIRGATTTTSNSSVTFDTTGPAPYNVPGRPNATLIGLNVILGPTLAFDNSNRIKISGGGSFVKKTTYDAGKNHDKDCPAVGESCLVLALTNPGVPAGQHLTFTQGIVLAGTGAPAGCTDLESGAVSIIYKFSDGLITSSRLSGDCTSGQLGAGSQQPDTTTSTTSTVDPTVSSTYQQTVQNPPPPCIPGPGNTCPPVVQADVNGTEQPVSGQPTQLAGLLSCTPSAALSALLSPTTVTAYVPNGSWAPSNATGIQVVEIEPPGGTPASISTGFDVINSCASNSTTGQTVCTANSKSVYLLSGGGVTNVLQSGATGTATFSTGSCQNCGVAINQATNTAAITVGLAGSPSSGIQFLNLANNNASNPIPAANFISEAILWDPINDLILSPNENSVYDLFDTTLPQGQTSGPPPSAPEYANNLVGLPPTGNKELDSAASDCTTGIALASDEFTQNLYLADLTQATLNPGATWNTATGAQQFVGFPEFNFLQSGGAQLVGISGVVVAPRSHLAAVTGEFGGNKFGVVQLPPASGTGTPTPTDWVAAVLPKTPDGQLWQTGLDPHPLTAYTSPNDGKAYALMANASPPTFLVVVDMQQLLNAPRVTTATGPHNVCQADQYSACSNGATPVDLIASGIVRYVSTH
jgi:hypothetical protein